MQLRDYQLNLIQQICDAWKSHDRVLLQLATGAGKSHIAMSLIQELHKHNPKAVVFFTVHIRELCQQVSDYLAEAQIPHSYIASKYPYDPSANTYVCMVQTLARKKLDTLPTPSLVIVDECHRSNASSYARCFNNKAKILGLSGTPRRTDRKPLRENFDILIEGPSIEILIQQGYLAKPKLYIPSKTAALVEQNRQDWDVIGGDYNPKAINKWFDDNSKVIFGDVIEHYRTLSGGKPTLVFCPNVRSVYETVQLFNDNGIPSSGIDGGLSDTERRTILQQFKTGQIKCVMSANILTEGYNFPGAKCGIFLRPTKSKIVYLQQIGRVLRPTEDNEPAILIDHVNNVGQHGPPWIRRSWTLDDYGTRTKRDTIAGVDLRLCLTCGNYVKKRAMICPICGKVFKQNLKSFKVLFEQLQCITIESANQLIKEHCQKILNREKYRMLRTREDFINFATEKGWANPEAWADKKLAEKKANDDIYFNGSREDLIVMFSKRKDVPNPIKKADETLAKREELKKNGKSGAVNAVYESGTIEEVIAYVVANKPEITSPEAYAAGVIRKRVAAVLENGTDEQKAAAQAMVPDKFESMVSFAKSGRMQNDDGTPKVLSDEEAEKFARNVVRKSVKAELESGDPVRVRAAVDKLHVNNPEAYTNTVLQGVK
jgi:superfamily II DNA or RNA helicase